MCLWLVIKCIEDIYKAITTSHNLPLTCIEKYLQISSNEFWLVVIPIQDIFKYDLTSQNTIRDISNYNLTSGNSNVFGISLKNNQLEISLIVFLNWDYD